MKSKIFLSLFLLLTFTSGIMFAQKGTRLLIVLGGKAIDTENFLAAFKSFPGTSVDTISKPAAYDLFASEKIKNYNAVVFYDTYQAISDQQKQSFLNIFSQGIGCIFLHHALVCHQEWAEYENILGGKYFHETYMDGGKKFGPSTYKHDQDFTVIVVNKEHPVTKGVENFSIHDESYINFRTDKDVVPLLTTDNCENGKYVGWAKTYNKSKVVYLQLGHDNNAYSNAGFRKLLLNSLNWVSQ